MSKSFKADISQGSYVTSLFTVILSPDNFGHVNENANDQIQVYQINLSPGQSFRSTQPLASHIPTPGCPLKPVTQHSQNKLVFSSLFCSYVAHLDHWPHHQPVYPGWIHPYHPISPHNYNWSINKFYWSDLDLSQVRSLLPLSTVPF